MRIDFSSSGGMANLPLEYRVDPDELSQKQAEELLRLVRNADEFNLPESDLDPSVASAIPDVIAYRLSLSEGNKQRMFWFNDVSAPAALRPLITRLRKLAVEKRRSGS